jgi:hypothetical protein
MEPLPTPKQIKRGEYPKWDKNTDFEKACLRVLDLPDDFHPTEEQAHHIVVIALDWRGKLADGK